MAEARFLPTGDTSVCVEFGNEISEKINSEIRAFNILLNEEKIKGIIETVPTYRSIMVHSSTASLSSLPTRIFAMFIARGSMTPDTETPNAW